MRKTQQNMPHIGGENFGQTESAAISQSLMSPTSKFLISELQSWKTS
uniref:Uncharacterized protein MANES_17G095300 n=1 Tax=Rhizophora mucronata TaxID=61149 RepID=A0A2P2KTQ3_RHIMU